MKCPLANYQLVKYEGEETFEREECLKEECPIYHDGLEDCGIFLIQEYLALILAQLVELVKKMPHELQFRK